MCFGSLLACAMQAGLYLAQIPGLSGIPTGTRGWETRPGVVRNDGQETFCIEVHTGGAFNSVRMESVSTRLVAPTEAPFALRDDGVAPDRVAGDSVHTAGPFRYRQGAPMPDYYMGDPHSPAGLDVLTAGQISMSNGTVSEAFLVAPSIGVLRSDVPVAAITPLSTDLAIAPHFVNVRTSGWNSQGVLRGVEGSLTEPARLVYGRLPDAFEFLVFFSTKRLERMPAKSAANFVAGAHVCIQVNYTGTGQAPKNDAPAYGSSGKLLGTVVLDTFERGIYGANVTHEILHQWGGFLPADFGLTDPEGHYNARSSIASLLGGQRWVAGAGGTFTLDCTQGRNGARYASPLDLYLMGVLTPLQVPDIYAYADTDPLPLFLCGQQVTRARTISVYDLIRRLGQRVPTYTKSRKQFTVGFVAESLDRMLTPTEMTFYETLAAHYTRPLPPESAPDVAFNWVPITNFYGQGVRWNSQVNPADFDGDGLVGAADWEVFRSCATGPGLSYRQWFPAGCPLQLDASNTLPADFNGDGDVDQGDFGVFQRLMSGVD